jgi:phosphoribosylamine-glycine ligase
LAQHKAYSAVEPIAFDGMQWRKDIGYRALAQ